MRKAGICGDYMQRIGRVERRLIQMFIIPFSQGCRGFGEAYRKISVYRFFAGDLMK